MDVRFKELKEKAKVTKTLDELFDIWSKAHQIDSNSERNMPNGINKDNFVKDGIIEEGSDVDVLFILKEANIKNYCNESHSQIGFYSEWIESGKGLNNPKQQLKMGLMAYYLLNAEAQDKKIDNNKAAEYAKEGLKHSAFININKRGGGNGSDINILNMYIEDYREFIMKEIELINPSKIVILGKYAYDKIIDVNRKSDVIQMWHTAYNMRNMPRRERDDLIYSDDQNVDLYISEFLKRVNMVE